MRHRKIEKMFVQNHGIDNNVNHLSVIKSAIESASVISLCVSYVRTEGVNLILSNLEGKKVELICSFDMNITQAQGIRRLLEKGVKVRIYNKSTGTFHPKVWIFEQNGERKVLITSANMTYGGLRSNIEAGILSSDKSIVTSATSFFSAQWNAENAEDVTEEGLAHLEEISQKREELRSKKTPSSERPDEISDYLFSFVKSWIDIPEYEQTGIGRLWRGWYIVPDHYLVDNEVIKTLSSYLPLIGDGVVMDTAESSPKYKILLDKFIEQEHANKSTKIGSHGLFVRQAKNYLIKFGWAYHPIRDNGKPNKGILMLTDLGREIMHCQGNIATIKKLYSQHFEDFTCYGMCVVPFTRRVLDELEYLTLREFDYFIMHSYINDDMPLMVGMIRAYRQLPDTQRIKLDEKIRTHFNDIKSATAKGVHGNYIKNIKYTMRVIAWCSGFSISPEDVLQREQN